MIGSLYDLLFRCGHKRTSFPHRESTAPGETQAEMYVVCLDCGMRFQYDWERMRIGSRIEPELDLEHTPERNLPGARPKTKVRYLVVLSALSALPALWVIGKRKRDKSRKE